MRSGRGAAGLLIVACLCAQGGAGCASPRGAGAPRLEPVVVTKPDAAVRVSVIGPLPIGGRPRTARGRLANFLYGDEADPSGPLRRPQGLGYAEGFLFVCDQGAADVLRYDVSTRSLRSWIRPSDRPVHPVSVAADASGVYVVDAARGRVVAFGAAGRRVGEWSPPRVEPFQPTAVAVHDGVLFISDAAGHCVHRVRLSSREWLPPLRAGKGDAPLAFPAGMAVTSRGELLVADALLGVVHRFDADGNRLTPIGEYGGDGGQLIRPMGVTVTPSGVVLVADVGRESILGFDLDGKHVFEVGGRRGHWSGFLTPAGVAWLPFSTEAEMAVPDGPSAVDCAVVSDMMTGELTLLELAARP